MKTTLIVIGLLFSANAISQTTNYIKKYYGAYNIGRDGAEAYALKEDGTCTWIYGWMSKGKLQTQMKYGTWTAREGYIRVSIKGNTGTIVEEYIFRNGRFSDKNNSNRYLVKR